MTSHHDFEDDIEGDILEDSDEECCDDEEIAGQAHRQNDTETVDQYLQELERLSKNCNFAAVTKEIYRQEYVRDAFINGLRSPVIRQRLLESPTLTLQQAFQQARTLELAQKHSDNFQSSPSMVAGVAGSSIDIPPDATVAGVGKGSTSGTEKQKCYFCGNDRHLCSKCPAKESTCNKCSKIGQWERVCRSTKTSANLGAASLPPASNPSLCATQQNKATNSNDSTMTITYVNNRSLNTLVDSGRDLTFISEKVAKKLKLFLLPPPAKTVTMPSRRRSNY
ncbi:uncharacterized protein [Clytia hemisphaerica]|uniref:uncharacterized protein n=1 Tax=Clytia hemisphaerica TaxID=252671 RepID=UPI0034D3E96E